MFEIVRYTCDRQKEWNHFVSSSKNGTFLFDRRYMDYHADRFHDHSLLFFLKGRLFAILPANRVGDTLHSHQGLTYGGLVTDACATTARVVTLFQEMNERLKADGIRQCLEAYFFTTGIVTIQARCTTIQDNTQCRSTIAWSITYSTKGFALCLKFS